MAEKFAVFLLRFPITQIVSLQHHETPFRAGRQNNSTF
jgi:hypothetical protein